jgi:hypothetical protein
MEDQQMAVEYCQIMDQVVTQQPARFVSGLAAEAKVVDQMLQVSLRDGRIISIPLEWVPFLADATHEQKRRVAIQSGGAELHWPDIGASLPILGLLAGSDPCSYCWYRTSHFG